ncbi:MAG: hypothetical protein MjAS7_1753 [Metallosphaera javensis (ex Sakai et al. 2022)]|nr:MAG: hypothetical protein MjAS7_1753 [Metallosphaera javensis (ex Sakai et al. 2022)]
MDYLFSDVFGSLSIGHLAETWRPLITVSPHTNERMRNYYPLKRRS